MGSRLNVDDMGDSNPTDSSLLEPGDPSGWKQHAEDPYADVDIDTLPKWWRDTNREFEEHGLPPYRPSVFEDGTLKHRVIDLLEARLDVRIEFLYQGTGTPDEWTVWIDDVPVGTIGYHRDRRGYSVFEMASGGFIEWILDQVEAEE